MSYSCDLIIKIIITNVFKKIYIYIEKMCIGTRFVKLNYHTIARYI